MIAEKEDTEVYEKRIRGTYYPVKRGINKRVRNVNVSDGCCWLIEGKYSERIRERQLEEGVIQKEIVPCE